MGYTGFEEVQVRFSNRLAHDRPDGMGIEGHLDPVLVCPGFDLVRPDAIRLEVDNDILSVFSEDGVDDTLDNHEFFLTAAEVAV